MIEGRESADHLAGREERVGEEPGDMPGDGARERGDRAGHDGRRAGQEDAAGERDRNEVEDERGRGDPVELPGQQREERRLGGDRARQRDLETQRKGRGARDQRAACAMSDARAPADS